MMGTVSFSTKLFVALVTLVLLQRLSELRLARSNEQWARRQGAREWGAEHYPLFFLLHGGWLVGWIAESLLRGARLSPIWTWWLALFAVASVLRGWAILSLGRRWNTRILVIEGAAPITRGPYRWFPHPNYVAVALELLSLPLVFGAWGTALVASLLNAALLLKVRIPMEERALAEAHGRQGAPRRGRRAHSRIAQLRKIGSVERRRERDSANQVDCEYERKFDSRGRPVVSR